MLQLKKGKKLLKTMLPVAMERKTEIHLTFNFTLTRFIAGETKKWNP